MKKLLNLCVTSLLAVSPSLWADPLAGHTLLTSLPRDATLLLKKEITLAKPIGKDFFFFYRVSKNTEFDLTRGVWVRCKNKRALNATQGDPIRLKIKSVDVHEPLQIYGGSSGKPIYKLSQVDLYFTTDQPELDAGCHVNIDTADLRSPTTVADAMAYLSEYFDFINDVDHYAGMEKSVVIDLLMAKISTSLKADDYQTALQGFAKLEKMGENLPESFYYHYADTLLKAGNKDKARMYAANYLKRYGKNGKYYGQVVEIMSRLL